LTETNASPKLPITARREEIRKLASIEKRTAQILFLLVLGSLWFQSWPIALGLILGGAVALLNFRWLWRIIEKMIFEKKKIYGLQVGLKFLALTAAVFLVLHLVKVHSVAFLVGASTLLPGIFIEVLQGSLRTESKGNG
jgi:hypothetical protein